MNLPPLPKVPEWFGAASRDIETDVKSYARQAQREAVAAAVPEGFKLASDLLTALDDLVSACELPGDHCEIDQALPAVIRILESAKAMLSASPEVKP